MDLFFALVGRVVKAILGLMFLVFTVSLAGLFIALAIVSWFVQRLVAIVTGRPVQPAVQWIHLFQRAQAFRRGPDGRDRSDPADEVVDVQAREVSEDTASVSHTQKDKRS